MDGSSSKETSCRRSCREGNRPQPLEVASLLKLAATNVLFPDVLKLGSASAERAWYVWESQQILKKYGINLLDDMSAAIAKARAGEKLHNLAWAINGNFTLKNGKQWYKYGIHSREYARAVYNGLKKIVDEGLRDGDTAEQIAAAIQKQLDDWRIVLERGGHFWY